jgi:hypothetical protein
MELASMLAGEAFSDDPRCVDPVIAAYMRSFNDRLGHADRQRLIPYAARAVGTRTTRAERRRRLDACLAFAGLRSHALARVRIALLVGLRWSVRLKRGAPEYAARRAIADDRTGEGFALIDQLLGEEAAYSRSIVRAWPTASARPYGWEPAPETAAAKSSSMQA